MTACVHIRPATLPWSSILSVSIITLVVNLLLLLLERRVRLAVRRLLLGRRLVVLLRRRGSIICVWLRRWRALVVAAVLRPAGRQFKLLFARLGIC